MANELSENSKIVKFAFDEKVTKEEQDLVFSCSTVVEAKEVLKKHRAEITELWNRVQKNK